MKKTAIIIILAFFFGFILYETSSKSDYRVLEVVSPVEIILDLNKNGVKDYDENFYVDSVKSFCTKPSQAQTDLAEKLKLSEEDVLGLGFLAEKFAKEKLTQKKIKLVSKEIYVDGHDYAVLLFNSGLAASNDYKTSPRFGENLIKVKKLNLRIFNEKSHKYHKLSCKYGRMAHQAEILPSGQLPKDTKPCNFCLVKQKEKSKKQKVFEDVIPDIKTPSTVFDNGILKIFLTDFTTAKKPSNDCSTTLCKALVSEIDSADTSVDFAIYGYTKIPKLEQALKNAQARGVKIRFVYDSDANGKNIYPDTLYLTKIFTDNRTDGVPSIMHDKFFIFGKKVLTGSANISNTDMSGFNSNAIILINSQPAAGFYAKEFEQMFEGKFHNSKSKIADKEHIKVGESDISIYFSPEDDIINAKIIPLINQAKNYVYMPVFLITHKNLAKSLIAASNRGVKVRVILDATNAHGNSTAHKFLRQNGIEVKTENFAGKLHSKSIIIDDTYTIIGSMNFSRSGAGVNDENLVIIQNPEIARFYKEFFLYLWQKIPDKWLKLNARAESPDSVGSCSDGIDNDFDGKIDKADDSCLIKR